MVDAAFSPCLVRAEGDARCLIRIGHPLLDAYLELVAARATDRSTKLCETPRVGLVVPRLMGVSGVNAPQNFV